MDPRDPFGTLGQDDDTSWLDSLDWADSDLFDVNVDNLNQQDQSFDPPIDLLRLDEFWYQWRDLEADALEVEEALSQVHFEDPTNPAPPQNDRPVDSTAPVFVWETAESISALNQGAPLPPNTDPSPGVVGLLPTGWTWFARAEADLIREQQDFHHAIGGAIFAFPETEGLPSATRLQDPGLPIKNRESPLERTPQTHIKSSTTASRCAPCRFAGVPKSKCNGAVGSVCSRCIHLGSKVDGDLVKRAQQWLAQNESGLQYPKFLFEPAESLSLPKIMFFELCETRLLLVALREEVDRVSQLKPRSLESMFDSTMLCHIDDNPHSSPYSATGSTVAIGSLATTASAVPASGARLVKPAIAGAELDKFLNRRRLSHDFNGFTEGDQEALTVAWKCAYWIAILLNWNGNKFLLGSSRQSRISLVGAKNLLLELTYSIAHRIQELIERLCHITVKSLTDPNAYGPLAVCCALWAVFAATHKFERYNFNARSLKNLRHFLSKLHERSRAAIGTINRYKWLISTRCCPEPRKYQNSFVKLVDEATHLKPPLNFAFEKSVSDGWWFLYGSNDIVSRVNPESYSDILEAEVSSPQDNDPFLRQFMRVSLPGIANPPPKISYPTEIELEIDVALSVPPVASINLESSRKRKLSPSISTP